MGETTRMTAFGVLAIRGLRATLWAVVGATLVAGLVLALALPIHGIDALTYGEWSRLIADGFGFHFPELSAQTYHRPLFYVLQGWVWGVLGFHESLGRLLALAFAVLLVLATARLARVGRARATSAALAAAAVCLAPDVREGLVSGLTDVPVAATVALAATLALTVRDRGWLPFALALATGAAVLTKPTALGALAALVAAVAIWPLEGGRARSLGRVAASVAAGAVVALAYHAAEASRLDLGLVEFLTAGSRGFYADLARESRFDQLVGLQVLGPDLRPLLVFAAVYAAARVARASHRRAALVAAITAPLASLLLPVLADGDVVESSVRSSVSALTFLALCGTLAFAPFLREEEAPSSAVLGRLLVLGGVPWLVWVWYGAYDTRLASVAWPGLVALVGVACAPAVVGLARRAPAGLLAPAAAVAAIGLAGYADLDGLGPERWSELRRHGIAGLADGDAMRGLVLPQVSEVVGIASGELGPDDTAVSADGRFSFFFPGRMKQGYPASCADLAGHRVFVLLTDKGTKAYMRDVARVPYEPAFWAACTAPRLTQLTDGSGGYAVFRVER